MSKNIINYIQMGLRSKKTIANKEAEKQEKQKAETQAFNKAFSDKTYTVAKKVIENVEKVADYDYESFFSRVNKVFDEKSTPTNKQKNNKQTINREERSKAFDEKTKNYDSRFNIDDYKKGQKNYKDSIIEKTKKNIQIKLIEAEARQQGDNQKKSDAINEEKDTRVNQIISKFDEVHPVSDSKSTVDNTIIDTVADFNLPSDEMTESQDLNESTMMTKTSDTMIDDSTSAKKEEQNALLEDISLNSDKNHTSSDETLFVSCTDSSNFNEEKVQIEKKVVSEKIEKDIRSDQISETPIGNHKTDVLNADKDVSNTFDTDICVDTDQNNLHQQNKIQVDLSDEPIATFNPEETTEVQKEQVDDHKTRQSKTKKNRTIYNKENLSRNAKYHKRKRKEKFARRMTVELEDNLIIKKRKSLSRLFKFSLAFKLSFVFVFLLIITIVSLSVSFYFGIDFVVSLKDAGKLNDIQTFKDVLLVLLTIFNLVAILLCISIGTKASRELVKPIDEMTMIVKQINAKEMDRRLNVKGMHDELKELAMTFNEMLDRIESSYETQNRFTSDASHELRTPIAVIQGYINMLDRWGKADGAILDESIEAIKSESSNMKRLTEKLLLLAKADKGILELEFKPFALNELIEEITRETAMIDNTHKIVNTINDVQTIVADRESLKQAIRIFVDNSVKYTPEGGEISINSYFSKKNIFIEIADNGIGIGKEDMNNIFNRFYRVDKSRTKESGGHGLGLSIAKWIVNQHKGEIEVKSELNKGTVITIIMKPPA